VTATRNTPGNQRASAGKRLTRERTMLTIYNFPGLIQPTPGCLSNLCQC